MKPMPRVCVGWESWSGVRRQNPVNAVATESLGVGVQAWRGPGQRKATPTSNGYLYPGGKSSAKDDRSGRLSHREAQYRASCFPMDLRDRTVNELPRRIPQIVM